MSARRPPLVFRVLLGASLALSLIPAAYAVRYTRSWAARAGLPVEQQRQALGGIPFFRPRFVAAVARLKQVLPPGERVLVDPVTILLAPRWHLYLAHYGHPLEFYVRRPELATASFNHRDWIRHHLEHPELDEAEWAALEERGVEWRLRLPQRWIQDSSPAVLERRVDGAWVKQSL